jgi:Flp pilus assembly protein TadD
MYPRVAISSIRLCMLALWIGSLSIGPLCIGLPSAFAIQAASSSSPGGSLYQQGRAAFDSSRWDEAAALMASAEAGNPGRSDALLYEGRALANAGRFAQADAVLRSYARQHPESSDALYLLGFVQQREDQPRDSLITYAAAAKLRTPRSQELTMVGLDYVLLKDYTDAIYWLEKAVALDSRNADAWYSLGRADYTQGRFPDAESALRKTLELTPKSIKAVENLGLTLDSENRPADAEGFFKQAVALASASPNPDEWPYLDYANFLLDHDRAAEAVPLLKKATGIDPKCAACHEKLGRALAANGDPKQGIVELEQAIALSPDDAHIHYELGLAYKQAGQMDKARVELAASARLYGTKAATAPTDPK